MGTAEAFALIVESIKKCSDLIREWLPHIKNKESIDELEKMLSDANSLVKSLQFDEALRLYAEISNKFPRNIRPRLGQILVLKKQGKHLKAIAMCGVALELSSLPQERARAYQIMGAVAVELFNVHRRLQDIQAAIDFFKEGKALNPRDTVIIGNLVETYATAAVRAKGILQKQKQSFLDLAASEIQHLKELASRSDCDDRRKNNIIMFVKGISKESDLMAVPLISSKVKELDALMQIPSDVHQYESLNSVGSIAKGLAVLAIATILLGIQPARISDADNTPTVAHPKIELSNNNMSALKAYPDYSDAWKIGIQVFSISRSDINDVYLDSVESVHEWRSVELQEYSVDEMTSEGSMAV